MPSFSPRARCFARARRSMRTRLPTPSCARYAWELPGVLPVINKQAVEMTILTGLALDCRIPGHAKFDRKNYAYPDLMKWYQISQYDLPFCIGGHLDVTVDGSNRRLGITRVHLEEDTARMIHGRDETGEDYSLLDVNRSGVPLMEVVSEPDMKTAAEAREYLMSLRNILIYLDVSTANMQDGAFRCDANISVWPRDREVGNSKVEVKNMNSFRSVYRALEFEEERQIAVWESGNGPPEQETRGWHEASGTTVSQRTKEYAHDYRYFAEPRSAAAGARRGVGRSDRGADVRAAVRAGTPADRGRWDSGGRRPPASQQPGVTQVFRRSLRRLRRSSKGRQLDHSRSCEGAWRCRRKSRRVSGWASRPDRASKTRRLRPRKRKDGARHIQDHVRDQPQRRGHRGRTRRTDNRSG